MKHNMVISELQRYLKVDFVTLWQSQCKQPHCSHNWFLGHVCVVYPSGICELVLICHSVGVGVQIWICVSRQSYPFPRGRCAVSCQDLKERRLRTRRQSQAYSQQPCRYNYCSARISFTVSLPVSTAGKKNSFTWHCEKGTETCEMLSYGTSLSLGATFLFQIVVRMNRKCSNGSHIYFVRFMIVCFCSF